MDKQTLTDMLESIRKEHMLGPKTDPGEIGERIDFAIGHGLIVRTFKGNFSITNKGLDLLEGKLSWDDI